MGGKTKIFRKITKHYKNKLGSKEDADVEVQQEGDGERFGCPLSLLEDGISCPVSLLEELELELEVQEC